MCVDVCGDVNVEVREDAWILRFPSSCVCAVASIVTPPPLLLLELLFFHFSSVVVALFAVVVLDAVVSCVTVTCDGWRS